MIAVPSNTLASGKFVRAFLLFTLLCLCQSLLAATQVPYSLEATLPAPPSVTPQADVRFGEALAIDGNLMVVGARFADATIGSTTYLNSGEVYVYDATTGDLLHTIQNPEPTVRFSFGTSVDVSGSTVIVGNGGSQDLKSRVYVYDLQGAAPHTPSITLVEPYQTSGAFGRGLKISGSIIAASAPFYSGAESNVGRVYIYDISRPDPTAIVHVIENPYPQASGLFGSALALSGSTLAVGYPLLNAEVAFPLPPFHVTKESVGVAFVYDLASATPTVFTKQMNNPEPVIGGQFGNELDISGSKIVIGAINNTVASKSRAGSAYVFDIGPGSGSGPAPSVILNNPTPATGNYFGDAVRIEGNTVVVGAYGRDVRADSSGSFFTFDLSSGTPTVPVLTIDNPTPDEGGPDLFGTTIAMAGSKVIVSAPMDDEVAKNAGAVRLYDLSSGTPSVPLFTKTSPLLANGCRTGFKVAASGALVAVCIPRRSVSAETAGSVYVYDMESATPTTPAFIIESPTGSRDDGFPSSVSISGRRLVVGVMNDDTGASNAGCAYVYELAGGNPTTPFLKLTEPVPVSNDRFGTSVAIDGDLIVIGTPGALVPMPGTSGYSHGRALVFDLSSANSTVPVVTLDDTALNQNRNYGDAVAIDGTRLIVGAPYDDTGAANAGVIFVYDLASGTPLVPVQSIYNPVPAEDNYFGSRIAISGTHLIAGVPEAGKAYVYDLDGATPSVPSLTLSNPNLPTVDDFGSVSISGSRFVVGAAYGDGAGVINSGIVYVHDLRSSTPGTPVATILNPTPAFNDHFGYAVAISGTRVLIGAPDDDASGLDNGGAYVFNGPGLDPDIGLETSGGSVIASGSALPSFAAQGVGSGQSMQLTIRNSGVTALTGIQVNIDGPNASDFSLQPLAPTVAAGGTINLTVTFTPAAIGTRTAILHIASSDPDESPYNVSLSGVGLPRVAFASAINFVDESIGTASITVTRPDSSAGTASVRIHSFPGTASVADFNPLSNVLVSFADGESAQTVSVTITSDLLNEANESFLLTLSDPQGGFTLSAPATTTVRIIDTVDTAKPTVTITAPASGTNLVEGTVVNVSGTAADNKGVKKVQFSLNGAAFADATLTLNATGTSATYTAPLALVPGPNKVAVKSIDTRDNESTVVTRSFNSIVKRPLVVNKTGAGTLTSPFPGTDATKQVGFTYTLKATPGKGQVFNGWTVNDATGTGITPAMQELPTLTFIHQEGLVLTANFILNPFTAGIIGRFDGLAQPSNTVPPSGTVGSNETVGGFTTTVMGDGSFTGTLKIDGLALPVVGIFDNAGVARFGTARATTAMLVRPAKPGLEVKLNLDMTGTTHLITGTVVQRGRSEIVAQSDIHANRAAYSTASKAPVALAGTVSRAWTMVFRHRATLPGLTSADYPQGDGYATGTVKSDGAVSFSGRLADHSAISASSALSNANVWPLYASLYGGRGSFACVATLTATSSTDGELSGSTVTWYRPYQNVQWYPWGWAEGIDVEVFGASYQSPAQVLWAGVNATNPVYGNVAVTFRKGLLGASVNKTTNFFSTTAAKVPTTDATWSFSLKPSSGAMNGTFTHSNKTKPAWQGVLIQHGANLGGYGYFMTVSPKVIDGTGEGGWVEMTAK